MISKPTLYMLPVETLHVDEYAQRSFEPNHAKKLSVEWDNSEEGVYKVSRRPGGNDYVFDGQHRRAARLLRDEGKTLVPALVYEGLTIAEEARLFVAYNAKTRRPNPIDVFRLSVVAHDPTAVAIQNVLDKHGLVVSFGGGPNSISAVASLRWLYREGGDKLVDQTLSLLEATWGPKNRDARDGSLLKAVGYVITRATGAPLDFTSMADKLDKNGKPGSVIGTARTYRQATGRSLWLETAHTLVAIYNRGRSSRRIGL